MTKKTILVITLVLGLVIGGTYAYAHGPGYGNRGYGGWGRHMMGSGWGHMMGPGNYGGPWGEADQETVKLRNNLYQKHLELRAVLAEETINEEKAKTLNAEINKLNSELSNKQLEAFIKFRKENPNQPLPFAGGPRAGYMHRGYGACWR